MSPDIIKDWMLIILVVLPFSILGLALSGFMGWWFWRLFKILKED